MDLLANILIDMNYHCHCHLQHFLDYAEHGEGENNSQKRHPMPVTNEIHSECPQMHAHTHVLRFHAMVKYY